MRKIKLKQNYYLASVQRTIKCIPTGHLVPQSHRIDIDATPSRRIDVNAMSFLHHVPAGLLLIFTGELIYKLGHCSTKMPIHVST